MRFPQVSREFEGDPGVTDQAIADAALAVPSYYGETTSIRVAERWSHPDERVAEGRVTVVFDVEHATRELDALMVYAIVSRVAGGISRGTGLRTQAEAQP